MDGWRGLVGVVAGPPAPRPCSEERHIQISGNTLGLKTGQVRALERLHRRRLPADRLVTNELARELCELSRDTRREVGVLVDRRGVVAHVMVGSARGIEMPEWGRLRAGRGRLRGLRCIHTHLGSQGLTRDDLTDLLLLRLDAMITVGVSESGLPGLAHTASLRPTGPQDDVSGPEAATLRLDPVHPAQLDLDFKHRIRELEDDQARKQDVNEVGDALEEYARRELG